MPIPPYMCLKDDGGADTKGAVDVQGARRQHRNPLITIPPHPLNTSRRCHATNPSCG